MSSVSGLCVSVCVWMCVCLCVWNSVSAYVSLSVSVCLWVCWWLSVCLCGSDRIPETLAELHNWCTFRWIKRDQNIDIFFTYTVDNIGSSYRGNNLERVSTYAPVRTSFRNLLYKYAFIRIYSVKTLYKFLNINHDE